MPRPLLSGGALAGKQKPRPPEAFDELLTLLTGEHHRLRHFTDNLAAENLALRERLRLCGDIADAGGEDFRNSPTNAACSPYSNSSADAHMLAPSSTWRCHLGTYAYANHDANANNIVPVAAVLAPHVPPHKAPVSDMPGSPGQLQVRIHERMSVVTSETEGHPEGDTEEANGTESEKPADRRLSEERRVVACMQKLRDMFEMTDTRQFLNLENVLEYLKKVGIEEEENLEATKGIFDRLVQYETGKGLQAATTRKAFASTGGRSLTGSSQQRFGSRSFSGKIAGPQVQLETFALLLLAEDIDEFLAPVNDQMVQLLHLLRTHTFHQDIMGILPSAIAVSNLEKDYKEGKFDQRFDLFMNIVIAANAICMGWFAQQKSDEWGTPQVLDIVFTSIFMFEMVLKLQRLGCRQYFCGKDWTWNRFDAAIVALGLSDFIMTLAVVSSGSFNPSSLMALRLLRLGRLLRVIRMSLFRELKLMINGIVGLLKTLGCALVILLVGIYFIGTVMVQLFGHMDGTGEIVPGQKQLFGTVPRSMFTVFRCLNLGDCAAIDGTPMTMHMSEAVGWPFTVTHSVLCVLMHYGLGSLITALVVDTTLNEAKKAEFRNSLKDSHKKHMSWSLHRLEQIFEEEQRKEDGFMDTEDRGGPSMLFLSRKCFQTTLRRQDVQHVFDEMDIDNADRCDLFDALDADGNGRIEIDELVGGLIRMSGKARRADTVATRLKMESLVKRLNSSNAQVMEDHRMILERLDNIGVPAPTTPGAATKSAWPSEHSKRSA